MKRYILFLLSCVVVLSSCNDNCNDPAPKSPTLWYIGGAWDTLYLNNKKYYMNAIASGTQLICEVSVEGGTYQPNSDFVVKARAVKIPDFYDKDTLFLIYEADSVKSYIASDGFFSTFNNLPNWVDSSVTVIARVQINSTYYNLRDKKVK